VTVSLLRFGTAYRLRSEAARVVRAPSDIRGLEVPHTMSHRRHHPLRLREAVEDQLGQHVAREAMRGAGVPALKLLAPHAAAGCGVSRVARPARPSCLGASERITAEIAAATTFRGVKIYQPL
jgi:hypothetical protein